MTYAFMQSNYRCVSSHVICLIPSISRSFWYQSETDLSSLIILLESLLVHLGELFCITSLLNPYYKFRLTCKVGKVINMCLLYELLDQYHWSQTV